MSPLRLVADDKAGPNAVGILVPPARRTFLIVRPRSLPFDLLVLAEADGTTFRDFDREQASRAAEALFDALAEGSPGCVELTESFQVRVHVGPFHLLACERRAGQPYAPLVLPDADSARAAAARITSLLFPSDGVEQEFYLNTRHFQR
jgi:hypothetical protein